MPGSVFDLLDSKAAPKGGGEFLVSGVRSRLDGSSNNKAIPASSSNRAMTAPQQPEPHLPGTPSETKATWTSLVSLPGAGQLELGSRRMLRLAFQPRRQFASIRSFCHTPSSRRSALTATPAPQDAYRESALRPCVAALAPRASPWHCERWRVLPARKQKTLAEFLFCSPLQLWHDFQPS